MSQPREQYVHPVVRAREPRWARWSPWPFRLLGLLVLAALLYGVYLLIFHLHITAGGNSQG